MHLSEENKELNQASGLPLALAPLQLPEAEIPGKTGPVPSGEWGINVAAAQDNFPRHGLQVFIPAWPQMSQGDSVVLLLGDEQVAFKAVDNEEFDARLTLFIPSNRLTDGSTSISYRVTRLGETPEDAIPTRVLIKLERPGGQDQDGDKPGHSALTFSLPQDIIDDGVDQDDLAPGVEITINPYPHMAEHDQINVSWGGYAVAPYTVTKADVGQDIILTVNGTIIKDAGDSDANGLAVVYEVYDLVDNRSEDWSAEIRVVVDTGGARLGAGIVKEAINNVLNLDTLGGEDATFQVAAEKPEFAEGDVIEFTLTGTTADGQPVEFPATQVVDNLPHIYEIKVANAVLRRLAKAQGIFKYRLVKANEGTRVPAKGRFVNIVGEPIQLAAPVAKDAEQGSLDPQLPMTTVEVPWDESMAAGQIIELKWSGTRPDQSVYFPELTPYDISRNDESAKRPILLQVEGKHLEIINGGTLEIYYELVRSDGSRSKSLSTPRLNVGEPKRELPAPTVQGAQGDSLDPDELPPNGTRLIVQRYSGIAIKDQLNFAWKGSVTGLYEDGITISAANLSRPEFSVAISLDQVKDNLGGTVIAEYSVARADGGVSDSEPLNLKIGAQQAELLDPVTVVELSDGQLDLSDVRNGATALLDAYDGMATGDVVYLEWTDGAGNAYKPDVDITENMVGKAVAFLVPYAEIEKNLDNSVTVISRVEQIGGGHLSTKDLNFEVIEGMAPALPAPQVAEADAEGIIDPDYVLQGATLVIGAAAQLVAGDTVRVVLTGNQKYEKTHTVTVDGEQQFKIAHAVIRANENSRIELQYHVRRGGVGPEDPSLPSEYDVRFTATVRPTISVWFGEFQLSPGMQYPHYQFTLKGTAAANQWVEMYDNGKLIGNASVGADGRWSQYVDYWSDAQHTVKAKARYGHGEESTSFTFEALHLNNPGITSIRDGDGHDVRKGGSTKSLTLKISGTSATRGRRVFLVDTRASNSIITSVYADRFNGTFAIVVNYLQYKQYGFAVYSENVHDYISVPWDVNVIR